MGSPTDPSLPRSQQHQTNKSWLEFLGVSQRSLGGVLVPQSCPTLCDSMDCDPPGSSVHGVFESSIPCVAISLSRGSSWPGDLTHVSWIGRRILHCEARSREALLQLKKKKKKEVPPSSKFPGGSDSKETAYDVGDLGSVPGSVVAKCSFLGNPKDRWAWGTTVQQVSEESILSQNTQTQLSD